MHTSVSIVVPAYNEERLIGRTLEAIRWASAALVSRGWNHELIVCDNNSTDRTGAVAMQLGARVVQEPINQIARARNRGAAAAEGEWLVFVDADSTPTSELFDEMARAMESGRVAAGGTTVRFETNRRWAEAGVGAWNWVSRSNRWMAGSFIFVVNGLFQEVGGFNQNLYAAEEIDLSRKLKRAAARRGKQVVILRTPLLTSARKMELYTAWEHLRFFLRVVLTVGRPLRTRDACPIWYDGRR